MNPVQQAFNFLPYGNTLSKMFLYFLGSAVLAFIISPLIINVLYWFGVKRSGRDDLTKVMDQEKGKIGTPIMGGLIVIIATVIVTFLFNWERNFTYLPVGAFVLSSCIGGIDDLLNIFGGQRKQPKPLKLHIRLAMVHKSLLKRFLYFITIPYAVMVRFFKMLGSVSKTGLQPHEKIFVQAFIGFVVGWWIYSRVGWTSIWVPYILNSGIVRNLLDFLPGISVNLQTSSIIIGWLIVPFIMLTIMTVTNAVNITDGMDGLAGGLLMISFISYAVIAFSFSQTLGNQGYRHIAYLCSTVAGTLLAYLYFNVKPARVQMGDIGSLALGTLISVIAIVLHREITLLFITGIILIDGIVTPLLQVFSVKLRGKKAFLMAPIHYHFELKGWPEEKVVVRFWIMATLLATIGVWIAGL